MTANALRNGSLKPLQNLQPMEPQRLADIFLINQIMLHQLFGDEPSPLHFRFQAASGVVQRSQSLCTPNSSLKKHPANGATNHRRAVNRRCPPAFSGCLTRPTKGSLKTLNNGFPPTFYAKIAHFSFSPKIIYLRTNS